MKMRLACLALAIGCLSVNLIAAQRAPVAGRFALELEGSDAGAVKSVGGGFAYGFVVEEPDSPDYFLKKHLEDPPGYKDITIECGAGMSAAFFQWITDVMNGQFSTRKNGAIVALDYNSNVVRRLQFADAQITRITFPRLDASSKDAGTLKVTLTLGDNQAQALFVSAHESVRRALEAALPQLRDTLAGQGIQLGQASVDAGAQQQQQAFNQERSFDAPVRPAQRTQPNAGAAVDTAPARAAASRSHSASGIDTFA